MQNKNKLPRSIYLIIAFINGGVIMGIELLAARMTAPFFGTSLYVWTSVLGVTLMALAAGYFIGGMLIDKTSKDIMIMIILFAGSILTAAMPRLAEIIMQNNLDSGVQKGSLVSCLFFLFPPMFLLAMISPMLIRQMTDDIRRAGESAGKIYAVSTVSGLAGVFLIGFYIIPEWGIVRPAFFLSGLLLKIPLLYSIMRKRFFLLSIIIVTAGGLSLLYIRKEKTFTGGFMEIKYKSEGLLGQLIVIDETAGPNRTRTLLINTVPQTYINRNTGYSMYNYVHKVATLASMYPENTNVLLCGLAGGSLADEFLRLGFKVDAVELDGRIPGIAKNFFGANTSAFHIFIDDARHYIKVAKKKYSVVVLDLYSGEIFPSHTVTTESLAEIKKILSDDGVLCILFPTNEKTAARSIYITLKKQGFQMYLTNQIFFASVKPLKFSKLSRERQNDCCKLANIPLYEPFISGIAIDSASVILKDDVPVLEKLFLQISLSIRNINTRKYSKEFLRYHIPLFN